MRAKSNPKVRAIGRMRPRALWQQNPTNRSKSWLWFFFLISTHECLYSPLQRRICARSEHRFTCYFHYYVAWYRLKTGIVASKYPSSKNLVILAEQANFEEIVPENDLSNCLSVHLILPYSVNMAEPQQTRRHLPSGRQKSQDSLYLPWADRCEPYRSK